MIFISHTHVDKPIVEPIAMRLGEIFGHTSVFYDSWSMQPGDGIISKMNEGLSDCKFFFFFVSNASLKSEMVKLEWQNALFTATKGQCKIIPVRLDSCMMPAILQQSLYIDLYSHGLEAVITQIVNVIQGNNTFTPQNKGFSNLTCSINGDEKKISIIISASHYLEPIPNIIILVENEEFEVKFDLISEGGTYRGGFNKGIQLNTGHVYNGQFMAPFRGITPQMPLAIELTALTDKPVKLGGVLHQKGQQQFDMIPVKNA